MPIVRAPATWHIEYRLEEGDDRVSTDKVWVRRPFDSRLETWSGAPPGTSKQIEQVATFARRVIGDETVLAVPPGVAPSDVRIAAMRDAAVEAGVLVARSTKTVAGRRCQVLRSKQLLSAPVLEKPTARDHGDSCVDEAGLVLEEVLVSEGKRLLRRVAVTVIEEGAIGDDVFPLREPTVDVRGGGGFVRKLVDTSRAPGEFFELPAPPSDGFTLHGRYSVVPPQPENFREGDPMVIERRRAAHVEVWTRGVDVILIEQGGTLGGAPPFAANRDAPTVDLGPTLGKGEIELSALEPAVRAILSGGRYVRVAGTLPPSELAGLARQLVKVEGSDLQFP